jgi:Domain of unknown function (DUF4124)
MRMHRSTHIPCLIILALFATTSEARLYRWVDEAGAVHYTDTLPPAQAERGHSEMSERGLVVDTTEPAKTPEELQREQEIKRAQLAAERAKKEQEAADQMLLRTFGSVDDMIMARNGRLASIEAMNRLTRGNIRRKQELLRALRADAADRERTGQPIPTQLSNHIANSEKSIQEAYATIVEREQQKQEIRATFARDLTRYRQLKNISKATKTEQDESAGATLTNLVPCANAETCDRLWARASAYVREHATTPVQASGPKIMITAPPAGDDDINLTLSRIPDRQGPGATLFLDAQCKPALSGDATCTSPAAQQILDGFSEAVLRPGSGD